MEEGTPKVERLEILVARYSLDFSWVCEQMLEKWLAQRGKRQLVKMKL